MTAVSAKPAISPPTQNANRNEQETDGAWLDARGVQGTRANVDSLTAAMPKKPTTNVVAVYINGSDTLAKQHAADLQEVAEATGYPTVGLHTYDKGMMHGAWEAIRLKMGLGSAPPPVRALTEYIAARLDSGQEMILVAYSRGSLVIEWALKNTVAAMRSKGLKDAQIARKLSAISVETYGGIADDFPSGPRYKHYVNCQDLFSKLVGPGSLIAKARSLKMDTFDRGTANGTHVRQLDIGTRNNERFPGHSLTVYLGYRAKDEP